MKSYQSPHIHLDTSKLSANAIAKMYLGNDRLRLQQSQLSETIACNRLKKKKKGKICPACYCENIDGIASDEHFFQQKSMANEIALTVVREEAKRIRLANSPKRTISWSVALYHRLKDIGLPISITPVTL